jgi:transmembrane sensor
MPLNDDIDAILVRYFSGRLSDEERLALEAWIREDPARPEQVARLRAVWEASASVAHEPNTEAALAGLKERIAARPVEKLPITQPAAALSAPVLNLEPRLARSRRPAIYPWRIAAGLALLVGGGLVWRSIGPRSPAADRPAPVRTYATARAERATLTLADGSIVMLNNETTLEVPATFGGNARDVYLRGEGYFQVAHDSTRPFRVHAAHAVTQVLGTKFNVRARPDEGAVQVAVAEGRVALSEAKSDSTRRVVLARGELGRLAADGRTSVVRGADAARALGWTEGRLAFERAPLPEVLAELSRWYDRDFVLGDSALAQLRLTTSLRGDSITEAIQVLEAALDVKAEMIGRKVVLHR